MPHNEMIPPYSNNNFPFFSESPIAIYSCNRQGYITAYNKTAAELWGRKPVTGQDTWCGAWRSFNADGSIMEKWQCPMVKVVENGETIEWMEMVIERPDGIRRKVLVYPRPIVDGTDILGANAFLVDVTSKEEQDTKHTFLSSIVESSDDAIISKNLDGIITSWNKGAERIFGYTEKEVLGKPVTILIPAERIEEESLIIGQIKSGRKVDHFQTVRTSKAGNEISISLTVSPVKDNKGRIVGASKIARDITKQAKAETAIRLYASNLEAINLIGKSVSEKLDVTKIMQYVVDVTTELTGASFGAFFYDAYDGENVPTTYYALAGISADKLKKNKLFKQNPIAKPIPPARITVNLEDIQDKTNPSIALYYRIPEKFQPKVTSYLQTPVISSSGDVIGELFFGHPKSAIFDVKHEALLTSIADQTAIALDNSKMFDEIKALSKKKDEFIALASHELNPPLTSVSGFLQILKKKSNDPLFDRLIHKTISEVTKLNKLVSDLLDVSRAENSKLPYHMSTFDCRRLLQDTLETFRYTFPGHNICIDDTTDKVMVYADKNRIEQVLINLLDNAIKYSPKTEKVYVSLGTEDRYLKISVRDDGIGMDQRQQQGLFTRFYRVSDGTAVPGLGLGLYLSKQIITEHGGELVCHSELGKGSEFYFTLPIK